MRRLIYIRDLLFELVAREMKLRYERSYLGILWAVINPLAQLAVFIFVFKLVFQIQIPNYPLFVFSGLLVWNWTREALMGSASAIVRNRNLIRQPGFPLALLPVVSLVIPLIDMVVAFPVLALFVIVGGDELTLRILLLPFVVLLHFILLQGLGYCVAAAHATFRDTAHLLSVALMLGFYLTPVFYNLERVPEHLKSFYLINPMVHILAAYRALFMNEQPPGIRTFGVLGFFALLVCVLGYRIFRHASYRFAEEF